MRIKRMICYLIRIIISGLEFHLRVALFLRMYRINTPMRQHQSGLLIPILRRFLFLIIYGKQAGMQKILRSMESWMHLAESYVVAEGSGHISGWNLLLKTMYKRFGFWMGGYKSFAY